MAIFDQNKLFKSYVFIAAGVALPVIRPFFFYNFSTSGDKALIFWVIAFQAASLPILTLALFDFSSQVFAKSLGVWRRNHALYRDFPIQVTGVLSLAASIFIWDYASVDFGKALLSASWCFASVVFIGKLKIVRLISVVFYYQCILAKVLLEFVAYLTLLKFTEIGITFEVFIVVDGCACLILGVCMSRIVPKKSNALLASLREKWTTIFASIHLSAALALASICVQLDKLLLIKFLTSTQYELYLGSAIYRGLGMSAGAVLTSFLYPHFAIHFRKPTNQSIANLKRLLVIFYIFFPVILIAVGFGVWVATMYIMPKHTIDLFELTSISMVVALSLNIVPESYLLLDGRNKVLLINGVLGISLQATIFYLLHKIGIKDYAVYIWVVVVTLSVQSGFLSVNAFRSLAQQRMKPL